MEIKLNSPIYGNMTVSPVSIPSLENGDVIYHHGLKLVLSDKATHPYGRDGSTVTNFKVELIGDWHEATTFPKHWIMGAESDRYHLQGNERATVYKII